MNSSRHSLSAQLRERRFPAAVVFSLLTAGKDAGAPEVGCYGGSSAVAIFLLLVQVGRSAIVEVAQISDPPGIIVQTNYLDTPTSTTTVTAPAVSGSYRFTHWTLNGVRFDDDTNWSQNPASFTLFGPTLAIAHYLPESQDTDADGLPDWYEIEYYGNLAQTGTSDTDSDGYSLAQEYALGFHPRVYDEVVAGGLSRIRSSSVTMNLDLSPTYRLISSPPGFVSGSNTVVAGTVVTTADLWGQAISGYRCAYWELEGVRQQDNYGIALGGFSFIVTSNTVATAHYYPAAQDSDADGVADWFEYVYYPTLAQGGGSDTGGDGYTLGGELALGTLPTLRDEFVPGGLARARSDTVTVNLESFPVYRLASSPAGFINASRIINAGAVITTPDLWGQANSGYRFAYWDRDGVRQQDVYGIALGGFSFTVTNNTVATAHYYASAQDSDADSVADWFEYVYFPTTTGHSRTNVKTLYNNSTTRSGPFTGIQGGDETWIGDEVNLAGTNRFMTGFSFELFAVATVGLTLDVELRLNDGPPFNGYQTPGTLVYCYYGVNLANSAGSTLNFDATDLDDFDGLPDGGSFIPGVSALTLAVRYHFNGGGGVAGVALYDPPAVGSSYRDFWEQEDQQWKLKFSTNQTVNFGMRIETTPEVTEDFDPDGDGLSLNEEFNLGTVPVCKDEFVPGGISCAHAASSTVMDMQPFEPLKYLLMNGVLTNFFAAKPPTPGGGAFGANVAPALGDWDGDGDLDLFVASAVGSVRVFENIGSRSTMDLSERTANFASLAPAWSGIASPALALGDWSGDGKADLVVGGDGGTLRVISSPGNFGASQSPAVNYVIAAGSTVAIPALADVTGDGRLDLLVLLGDGTVRVYPHTGSSTTPYGAGIFTENLLGPAVPDASGISAADINADGWPDVLVADGAGRIWEFHGAGAGGGFTLASKVWAGSGAGFANRLATLSVLSPPDLSNKVLDQRTQHSKAKPSACLTVTPLMENLSGENKP